MTDKPPFLMFGDSHTVAVRDAYWKRMPDKAPAAFQLPLGRGWVHEFYSSVWPLRFTIADAQRAFEKGMQDLGLHENDLLDHQIPMILSLTAIERVIYHRDWLAFSPLGEAGKTPLSHGITDTIIGDHYHHVLAFHAELAAAGFVVFSLIGPGPRQPQQSRGLMHLYMRDWWRTKLGDIGVGLIDVTDKVSSPHGELLEKFWLDLEGDYIHGNVAWGQAVLEEIDAVMADRR